MEICQTLGDFYIILIFLELSFKIISINDQDCISKYFIDYLKSG